MAPREGVGGKSGDQGPGMHGWGWGAGDARPGWRAGSHLGEDVSRVGSGRGQRGEEGGLARRLDGVDHPQLGIFQVGGLAVGVDEHKDVVHTYRREPGQPGYPAVSRSYPTSAMNPSPTLMLHGPLPHQN